MTYLVVLTKQLAERGNKAAALSYASTVRLAKGEKLVVIRHEQPSGVLAGVSPEASRVPKSAEKEVPRAEPRKVPRAKQTVVARKPPAEEGRRSAQGHGRRGKKTTGRGR